MNRGARASTAAAGIVFGFLVTSSGFGSYTTIHQALLLRSWYLFAVFGSAAAVAAAGLALVRRTGTSRYGGALRLARTPARPHHLYGAAIFGAGFGLTGTCPGSAIAMVATGGLGGLLVLTGLAAGMWLRGVAERPASGQHPEAGTDQREQPQLALRAAAAQVPVTPRPAPERTRKSLVPPVTSRSTRGVPRRRLLRVRRARISASREEYS